MAHHFARAPIGGARGERDGIDEASATTGGHFTFAKEHTLVIGQEAALGNPIGFHGYGEKIFCPNSTYKGTVVNFDKTEQSLTLTPTLNGCHQEAMATVHPDLNGCDFVLTVGKKANSDNTFHLACPGAGPYLTVTGPFGTCTITITPNQTPAGGVSYTAGGMGATHDITAKFTIAGIHLTAHGGVFVCGVAEGSTTNAGEITGETTLKGYETNETTQVGLTATGSEDA